MTMCGKQILARANHVFFRDNKASILKKRHTLLCILLFFRIIVASLSKKKCMAAPIFFLDLNGPG